MKKALVLFILLFVLSLSVCSAGTPQRIDPMTVWTALAAALTVESLSQVPVVPTDVVLSQVDIAAAVVPPGFLENLARCQTKIDLFGFPRVEVLIDAGASGFKYQPDPSTICSNIVKTYAALRNLPWGTRWYVMTSLAFLYVEPMKNACYADLTAGGQMSPSTSPDFIHGLCWQRALVFTKLPKGYSDVLSMVEDPHSFVPYANLVLVHSDFKREHMARFARYVADVMQGNIKGAIRTLLSVNFPEALNQIKYFYNSVESSLQPSAPRELPLK